MGFMDLFKPKWKHSYFIGKTICFALILSMLSLLIWADIFDKINKLKVECQSGNEKACAKLAEIAKYDEDVYVRQAAVKKITDQTVLDNIAKNDEDGLVRLAATNKLNDKSLAQRIYADIAKNDKNIQVRKTAVNNPNLTDQALLANLVKNCKYDEVRKAAMRKLTDQAALDDIAKNNEKVNMREAAVEKLTDQAVLADVAKNDKDKNVPTVTENQLNPKTVEVLPGVTQVLNSQQGDPLALREVEIPDGQNKNRIFIGGFVDHKTGELGALVDKNSFEFVMERWPGNKSSGDLHVLAIPDAELANFDKKVADALLNTLIVVMQEGFRVGIARNIDEIGVAINKAEGSDIKVDKNLFLSIFNRKNRCVGFYLQFNTETGTEALFKIGDNFYEPGPNGGRPIGLFDLEKGMRNKNLTIGSLAGKISFIMEYILSLAKEKYDTGLRVMNYELYLIGNEIMIKFTFNIGKGNYVSENYSVKLIEKQMAELEKPKESEK